MHRFFLPPEACAQEFCRLSEPDVRHAQQVLRLKPGDSVQIIDGQGGVLEGRTEEIQRRSVTIQVTQRRVQQRPQQRLGLALALLKPKALDLAMQKAVELGAEQIWLLQCDRSVARWHSGEVKAKMQKWETHLLEAMKQCGQAWKPSLHAPEPLASWIQAFPSTHRVFYGDLDEGMEKPTLLEAALEQTYELGCWCVGPEGDFTPEERTLLRQKGARPCSLGDLVLRSETAALSGLSVLSQLAYRRTQHEP